MTHHQYIAYGVAGILAISLVLGGCGNNTSQSGETSQAPAETTETLASQSNKVLYWEGTTDADDEFYFFEDQANATGSVVILHADHTTYSLEGSLYIAADGTVSITHVIVPDDESGEDESEEAEPETETYSFKITDRNETSLLVEAGESGKGTLKPVTEEEFQRATVEPSGDDESLE